jgi:hypothetical protein
MWEYLKGTALICGGAFLTLFFLYQAAKVVGYGYHHGVTLYRRRQTQANHAKRRNRNGKDTGEA